MDKDDKASRLELRVKELERSLAAKEEVCEVLLSKEINERVQAEAGLRLANQRLFDIIEFLPDATFVIDGERKVIAWNKAMEAMTGIRKEGIIGQGDYAYAVPFYGKRRPVLVDLVFETIETVERVAHKSDCVRKEKDALFSLVYVPMTCSGKGAWLSCTASPLFDAEGRIVGAIQSVRDVTEQKQTEEELAESEERYRIAIESSNDGVAIIKEDKLLFVNRRFLEMFGYTAYREIIGKSVTETVHPDDLGLIRDINRKRQMGEAVPTRYEFKGIKKDGTLIYIEVSAAQTYYQGDLVSLVYLRDITARRRVEEALRQAEEKYRSIFENAMEGIFQTTPEGRYLSVNPALAAMYGYESPQALIDTVTDIQAQQYVNPKDRDELMRLYEGQGYVEEFETQNYRKDGGKVWISMSARAVRGPDGGITHYEGSVQDITTRKRAEETLRESEETLRTLINASQETLLLINTAGMVLVANETVAKRLGATVKELTGSSLYDYFPPDVARARKALYDDVAATGKPLRLVDSREGRSYETYASPVFNGEGKVWAVAVFASDVSQVREGEEEQARLESQLRQSQKMEAIGTLAGGIAHDFNNILTAIIGYGSLLKMQMEGGDPKKMYVDHILSASQKAAVLTQSLLAFSRKQMIELKPRRINAMVSESEKLLKRLLTEDIELSLALAQPDIIVNADATQIDQVLMNLATNARDAMPNGGRLTIEIKAAYLDDEFAKTHGYGKSGDYASILVSDTGAGMDRETVEKIFEPFFTTKEVGKGTGLGLSTVYGIVSQHKGYIDVESESNKGTRFTIYLPSMETETGEKRPVHEDVKGGFETVLVAEDSSGVRQLAREVLRSKGYTVIEATDGDDAVRRFMEHKDEIALLILDVVMPKKNGKEVYEEIRKVAPGIKVIFTSGYTRDVILGKGIQDEAINFVSKPHVPNELLKKVRETLDR